LVLTAQTEKEAIFLELSKITPSMIQEEFVAPEVHQKIQELTKQLEFLTTLNPRLTLTAMDYVKQADALYFESRYDDAVESYEKALQLQPDLIPAWLGRAKILRRLKRYEEAVSANQKVLQLQPDNPKGWFGLGYTLKDAGRYEEAIAAFDRLQKLQPNNHQSWKHQGYVLTKLGNYDQALRCFDQALQLKSSSGGTYYSRAYYYLSLGNIEAAIADLQHAIEMSASNWKDRYWQEMAKTDPDFDSLREDDRFKQLMETNHL
jgi:tetratricopeptide (TPR) repeat protein